MILSVPGLPLGITSPLYRCTAITPILPLTPLQQNFTPMLDITLAIFKQM